MTIIEVDSVNHEALTVDSIQIFAGQRYSFVVSLLCRTTAAGDRVLSTFSTAHR